MFKLNEVFTVKEGFNDKDVTLDFVTLSSQELEEVLTALMKVKPETRGINKFLEQVKKELWGE